MTETLLPCVELNPDGPVKASVIWLHGLGADGHDFAGIVPELRLPASLGVRFVFPHAPLRPITLNGGAVMRGWYDIVDFSPRREDEAGIRASSAAIAALVDAERSRGTASECIVLAGFSQGGAVALHTALRYGAPLAGVLALSTYLPLAATLEQEASPANRDVPLFIAHGEQDTVIPLAAGEATQTHLKRLGYPVQWHTYAMGHGVCNEEIADISRWLRRLLAAPFKTPEGPAPPAPAPR
ncbi:MAG TPA: carboxylesterase [Gammaproteobacteria bacterium]|nr:carboxylesterase [Gammaproteobacteria bacterium]